ncbi:hypothetical protein BDY17DRAFT_328260 [Neohortaea acidophila]|uniref:Selenoprotein O n=1 Tax=Neohortaea acidophila TaxID=245834 RepID=A0A6A6PFI3_9PEZI|nr:uncharacterized protein BDY17DRAFT_328260 [Neohortaea acidophila]KAF2478739.1 hypothetical protein BDY17DRAFT_328260 [Neohortaea acidophila]
MAGLVHGQPGADQKTFSLKDLPKSNTFTSKLPPDEQYPTPAESHKAERKQLGPRLVKNAAYTFVRPDHIENPELLAVSKAALKDLAIDPATVDTDEFKETVAGNRIITLEEGKEPEEKSIYPWAQCYGGFQFGQWAGQLGDGRAISLFETTNPATGKRYELQLKGAGKTPYSRFADGKAVLRSSLREFVVSESLHALGIPTTRALSLVLAPEARVRREMTEPGAIVCRFAESWLRIGTFDLARSRGDRELIRKLADYLGEDVIPWETLPGKLASDEEKDVVHPSRGVAKDELQGTSDKPEEQENRYSRLYREIVRRNAKSVAAWQAYAFTNGVLNTDNTSIFGLSIDYGPFAFLDNFDPSYSPNHDDHMLRYAYKNQPQIIWWNLTRLGESFGELIGAGDKVDTDQFKNEGVAEEWIQDVVKRGQHIIQAVGEEYQKVFLAEYKRLMVARLGLKAVKESDLDDLISEYLGFLEGLELDFNHTFRRLSSVSLEDIDTDEKRKEVAGRFFHQEGLSGLVGSEDDARERIAKWLVKWADRVKEDWGESANEERSKAMKAVNPKFIPRSWILDEAIERVEKKGDRQILGHLMEMALNPFNEEWDGDKEEAERFCGDVPKYQRAMQCSCSS